MLVHTKQPSVPGAKDEGMAAAMNKQMMYMMPVVTVIIGTRLPGGLTLYWLLFTLLTVLQQYFLLRTYPMQTINNKQLLNTLPVETQSGKQIGVVVGFDLDVDSQVIISFHVKPRNILRGLFNDELRISRDQVIELTTTRLLVEDTIVGEYKKTAEAVSGI